MKIEMKELVITQNPKTLAIGVNNKGFTLLELLGLAQYLAIYGVDMQRYSIDLSKQIEKEKQTKKK